MTWRRQYWVLAGSDRDGRSDGHATGARKVRGADLCRSRLAGRRVRVAGHGKLRRATGMAVSARPAAPTPAWGPARPSACTSRAGHAVTRRSRPGHGYRGASPAFPSAINITAVAGGAPNGPPATSVCITGPVPRPAAPGHQRVERMTDLQRKITVTTAVVLGRHWCGSLCGSTRPRPASGRAGGRRRAIGPA